MHSVLSISYTCFHHNEFEGKKGGSFVRQYVCKNLNRKVLTFLETPRELSQTSGHSDAIQVLPILTGF